MQQPPYYTPSPVVQANINELTTRERTGIVKYGVSLSDASLPLAQLLQHLLEEQLDGANYIRAAMHALEQQQQTQAQEYALLRREIEQALQLAERLKPPRFDEDHHPADAHYQGKQAVLDLLKRRLFQFDTAAVLRQAARR